MLDRVALGFERRHQRGWVDAAAGAQGDPFAFDLRPCAMLGERRPGGDDEGRLPGPEEAERAAAVNRQSVVVADEFVGERFPFGEPCQGDVRAEEHAQLFVHGEGFGRARDDEEHRAITAARNGGGDGGAAGFREPETQRTLPDSQEGLDFFGNGGRQAGKLSGQAGKPSTGQLCVCPNVNCSIRRLW